MMHFYIACIHIYICIYQYVILFITFKKLFENVINVNMLYFTLVRKHVLNKPLIY